MKGGGVGQERKAAARKRPAPGGVFSVAFSWWGDAPEFGLDEFVLGCSCLSPLLSGKSHGPRGRRLRHLGQLLACCYSSVSAVGWDEYAYFLPSHVYVEKSCQSIVFFLLHHDV